MFNEGDKVVCLGWENTINQYGGHIPDIVPLIGRVMTVWACGGRRVTFLDDPIHYIWHVKDFRLADKKEMKLKSVKIKKPKKPKLNVPMWVHNIKEAVHYPVKSLPAQISFAVYDSSCYDTKTPEWKAIKNFQKHPVSGDVCARRYENAACFAAMSVRAYQWNTTKDRIYGYDKKHLIKGDAINHLWMCIHLSWFRYEKTNKKKIISWLRILKANGCLPKNAKYSVDKKYYTVWFPINNLSNRFLFQICCFIRDLHEHPHIVSSTLNLVRQHKINFFVAYVLSHALSKSAVYNHSMFEYAEELKTLKSILRRAMQIEKYTFKIAPTEQSISGVLKKGKTPGRFALAEFVSRVEIPFVPAISKDWNALKGLNLKHS